MILVDSSVWIDHFRRSEPELVRLLDRGEVATHAMVIGELACGKFLKRSLILQLLNTQPRVTAASDRDVLTAIEARRWHGQEFGWIDAHLLTSAMVSGARLWTRDKSLLRAAQLARVAYDS
jgi:predicted nucleic acid-binding protein